MSRLFGLGKHIGERLFHVAVFAGADDFGAQLCMLEVAGGDHHAVDVIACQHVFGILIGLRLGAEGLLHLCCPVLTREAPQIADGNRFNWKLLRRKLNHVHMSFASVPAP